MPRNPALQVRLPLQAFERLAALRQQRHLNVSAWARQVLLDALQQDFPADADPAPADPPPAPPAPIPGWRPCRLHNGWGSALSGPAADCLPDNLPGALIAVTDSKGFAWTATVSAVVERSPGRVTVTDSGRPGKPF